MVAFYAWTDTLLINAVQLKSARYEGETADLIVLGLGRVSRCLVAEIEKSGLFRQVLWLREPDSGMPGVLRKLTKPLSAARYYRQLAGELSPLAGQEYRQLITGGFWSYTLFVYRFLAQRRPELELVFLEEGIASYAGTDSLFLCDPLSRGRSEFFRRFFYRDIYPRARAAAGSLYLFCPQACLAGGELQLLGLGDVTPATRALNEAASAQMDVQTYRQRRVILFLQPESEADGALTIRLIETLIAEFGPEQLLIKPHADSMGFLARLHLPEGVYIERSSLPLDHLMWTVDWEDKLLLSRGTSCLFYPRYMRGQEAAVMFLYPLFPAEKMRGLIRDLSRRLTQLYGAPERVMFPNDLDEYKKMLVEWKRQGSL